MMKNEDQGLRLAIDVGGTFTDAVLWCNGDDTLTFAKVPSTPGFFAEGVISAAQEALARAQAQPSDIARFVHSSTVAANVVAERRGAKVGLLTTSGFRDVLELQRSRRDSLFNLYYEKPVPLVPRALRLEVPERIDAMGDVVVQLDERAARRAIGALREAGCDAVAIVFLFSFLNPQHERRVAEIVHEEMPNAFVSLSSTVNPELREYERTSTTVIDAYVKPEVSSYYRGLESRLRDMGFAGRVDIFHSAGGIMGVHDAIERPVHTVESGPAAGATAAAHIARTANIESAIAFDMGGTTAKACLIEKGRLKTINSMLIERRPVRAPVIDLVEISGGGGTLAWIDESGLLRVGPRSAGATPGPACYGKGGTSPTITDANAILGYYPSHLIGGNLKLDMEAARRAIRTHLCDALSMNEDQAALGILRIANANMEGAIRLVTTQRGIDPRSCTLIAFGGAGPVHAAFLAMQIGIPQVLVPPAPGNVNAFGALVADTRYDYHTGFFGSFSEATGTLIVAAFERLEAQALASLSDLPAADRNTIALERFCDLRYVGQGFELTVPCVDLDDRSTSWKSELAAAFHKRHLAEYKHADPAAQLEFIALRIVASLAGKPIALRPTAQHIAAGRTAGTDHRLALFPGEAKSQPARVWDRNALALGWSAAGPAIIEEYSSTTVVPPGCSITLDKSSNLIIDVMNQP
jgi:N-methylhydantoinase A